MFIFTINMKIGHKMKLGYMRWSSPWNHASLLLRFMESNALRLRGTYIHFHILFVINHSATPRTSSFLWCLLFDKLKLTDMAERFVALFFCALYTEIQNTGFPFILYFYILQINYSRPLYQVKFISFNLFPKAYDKQILSL